MMVPSLKACPSTAHLRTHRLFWDPSFPRHRWCAPSGGSTSRTRRQPCRCEPCEFGYSNTCLGMHIFQAFALSDLGVFLSCSFSCIILVGGVLFYLWIEVMCFGCCD